MNLQPTLSNEIVRIRPLQKGDFVALYEVASDKSLWEQHPNNDRYKEDIFSLFFNEALESKGAFVIIDIKTNTVIGSSRFYNLDEVKNTVVIGFTFIGRKYWGTNYNRYIKNLMVEYAFQFLNSVHFHVAKSNFRSQKAMEKLEAKIIGYTTSKTGTEGNPVYEISKENWLGL